MIERFTSVAIGGLITLDDDSNKSRLVDLRSVTRLIDETGKALGPARTNAMVARAGGQVGRYSCVKRGNVGRGFTTYRPVEIFRATKVGNLQFQFHPYRYRDVRTVRGRSTVQYEVCGTGGADLKNGYRAYQVGAGMFYPSSIRTTKIGQRWRTGATPTGYNLSLGFEVSGDKIPVSIGGSIAQDPTDKLTGSINGPFPTWADSYARNGINACPCHQRAG